MTLFTARRDARLILATGAALLLQMAGGSSQELIDGIPDADYLPAQDPQLVGPVLVQPLTEPTMGEDPVLYPIPLFPNEPITVQTADGKSIAAEPMGRRWRLLLGVNASVVYDDNIFLTDRNEESDLILSISPMIGVAYGDASRNLVSLTYIPTFSYYTDHSDENAIEHAVDLVFRHQGARLLTEANLAFRSLDGSTSTFGQDADERGELLGERVSRNIYVAGFRATYSVSDKTFIEAGVAANYSDYEDNFDTLDVAGRVFADYMVTSKTRVGVGFGIGYAETEGGPGQTYEQALARINYTPTSKISLSANGGVEFRQVDGGDDQTTPVFGLGIAYTPFDNTVISLDGYSRVRPSSVVAESNYAATGIVLSVRQRFLGKFFFTLAGGYEHTEYETLVEETSFPREDDYVFVRPSLEFRIRERLLVELFYEYRANDSSLDDFEFANNRVGLRVGFTF